MYTEAMATGKNCGYSTKKPAYYKVILCHCIVIQLDCTHTDTCNNYNKSLIQGYTPYPTYTLCMMKPTLSETTSENIV